VQDDRWLYALTLSAIAAGVTGVLVPLYLVSLGAGAAVLGLAAALSSIVGAPAAVLAGRHADHSDTPRRIVLGGFALAAVAAVLFPVVASVPVVVALNAVLAVALAAVGPVVTTFVVSGVPDAAWDGRIARLNTFQGYGGIGGLLLGTAWTGLVTPVTSPATARRSLFVVAALIAVAAIVIAARSLPAHPGTAGTTPALRPTRDATFLPGGTREYWAARGLGAGRLRAVLANLSRSLRRYFLGGALFFVGFGAFWAPLPLYLTDVGFGTGTIFALYVVNAAASTLTFTAAGRLSTAYDTSHLQGGALGIRGTAFLGVGVVAIAGIGAGPALTAVPIVAGLLGVIGLTWAVIAVTGTAIVSRLAPRGHRGAVLGGYAALAGIGQSVGSLLGGGVASWSFPVAFAVAGTFVAAGGLVVYRMDTGDAS